MEAALPWAVAAIALVAVIALVVGQRFATSPSGTTDVLEGSNGQGTTPISAPGTEPERGMPRAPDISQLTPAQRAERLYDRIMTEHEAGRDDAVRTFLPMALAAYEMLGHLTPDQRYDVGRIGEVAGDAALARAQSDTILRERPTHLLGLILGASAARMSGDTARARRLEKKLVASAPTERSSPLPEYVQHQRDIDAALASAQRTK
jgi:hypothetical protein